MSRYPPPPSFGVPFNPNGQFAPSQSAPYPDVSNFLFFQSTDPSQQGRAHQPASFANNYPFNATSQNVNVPASRPGVPQVPFSGFGQMTSSSFPTPPYPSIQPLPYGSFSHPHLPPPPLLQRETPSASIQTHLSLPSKPPQATSPTAQGLIKDTPMSTATITELEDGELSDRDAGRHSGGPLGPVKSNEPRLPDREREVISRRPSILGIEKNIGAQATSDIIDEGIHDDISHRSGFVATRFESGDHHRPSAGAKSRHSPIGDKSHIFERNTNKQFEESALQGSAASSQSEAEIRLKDVPPAESIPDNAVGGGLTGTTRPSHVGIAGTRQPTPVRANHTGHPAKSKNHGDNHADIPSPISSSDLRQRAKAVLKELYPLKIGFVELVKEGIEPKLLMELYGEIGIGIPLSSHQNLKANSTEINHQDIDLTTFDPMEPESVSISSSQIISPQQKRDNASKDSFLGGLGAERSGTTEDAIRRDSYSNIEQNHLFPKKIAVPQTQIHGEPCTQSSTSVAAQTSTNLPKITTSTSKLAKTPTTTILGKPTRAKPGEKALERKEYIARMLAAKAGRPIPASSTPHTTDTATDQPQEIQLKPGSPKQVNSDEEEGLLVENLSYRATELDLKAFFSAFPIKKIHIPLSPTTKKSLGYSFIVLMHPSESLQAVNELSGKTLVDRKVSVKSVRSKDVAQCLRSSSPKAEQGSQIVPLTPGNSEVKPDSKKSAQTELARQKMEALRARESHTTDENRHAVSLNQEIPAVSNTSQNTIVQNGVTEGGSLRHNTENETSKLPSMSTSKMTTFNIPGLFMKANLQEVATLNDQTIDLKPSTVTEVDGQPTVDIQKNTQASAANMLKESPTVSVASGAATQQSATLMQRKRHKAADFIDSPSVRIRRSLGQTEDTSVIIEVSEDEGNENSGDDVDMDVDMDIEIEEDARPITPQHQLPNLHHESSRPKSIRDQPPLSDVPTRKPVTPRILGRTPPKVLTPKKSKEPQGLEIEIELMDRKIAEMQQRILAKQNASRAQTPDKSGNLGKIVGVSTTAHLHIKRTTSSTEEASMPKAQTYLQKPEDIDTAEVATVAQAALIAEKAAVAAKAIEQERILTEQHVRALEQARLDAERLRAAEAEKIAEEERRRSRRTEIEAGIPVLDAEMERATQKLHSLKRQIEELEIEVQKGVEGRRALLEELTGLSSSLPHVNIPQNDLDGSDHGLKMRAEDVRREDSNPSYFANFANSQQTPNILGNDRMRTAHIQSPLIPPEPVSMVADALFPTHEQRRNPLGTLPAQNDLEELNDIGLASTPALSATRSPINSEEDYVPSITRAIEASILNSAAENTNHSGLIPVADPLHTGEGIVSHTDNPLLQSVELDMIDNDPGNIGGDETGSGPDSSVPIADPNDSDDYEPPEPALTVEPSTGPLTTPSAIVVDEAKSLFPSSMIVLEPLSELTELSPALSINGEPSVVTTGSASPEQLTDTKVLANSETNYYIPYESPLKKFKSYRYHPEYLHDVPRGFRSLTYSHGIDFNKRLCQYETAGGTCNDNSCENQHFKSMGLSDDMILVQMGAIPEGLTHEAGDAYANGLKQIIQEIRSKKVRDFNVVASEITAYRAKFLGEKVKVLPL